LRVAETSGVGYSLKSNKQIYKLKEIKMETIKVRVTKAEPSYLYADMVGQILEVHKNLVNFSDIDAYR